FVTAEGLFLSSHARNRRAAMDLIRFIASDGAVTRAAEGEQMVAWLPAYDDPVLANAPPEVREHRAIFLQQLDHTVPMSNRPEMGSVWGPAEGALRKTIYGVPSGETPYWMLLGVVLLVIGVVLVARARDPSRGDPDNLLLGVGLACLAGLA